MNTTDIEVPGTASAAAAQRCGLPCRVLMDCTPAATGRQTAAG